MTISDSPSQTTAIAGRGAVGHALLEVRDLKVVYRTDSRHVPALRGLSLTVREGETLGVMGETGSGKSTLAHSVLGLLPPGSVGGVIRFRGEDLPVGDEAAMRAVRWRRIALVFQSASTGFDPVYRVGEQIIEPIVVHLGWNRAQAGQEALRLWGEVGLPAELFGRYPHQLSGGEKRLAMLAMALACQPELLLLDEPTAGLDSMTRARVLSVLRRLRDERRLTMILITHTLGDLAVLADRAMVLYAGRVVEAGLAGEVLAKPRHPYTWGLVNAYPNMARARDLWAIRGDPPCPPAAWLRLRAQVQPGRTAVRPGGAGTGRPRRSVGGVLPGRAADASGSAGPPQGLHGF
ncbi:MAG: ABC transporter ATP-binding protein [Chloroflexota bacterium]